uniref:Uncharacterized protein n=1 Tax=Oryza sativa subsp. japonica TaxID=39947 RepID=Q69J03_ORYSJ|nr:hypothetical protein [Oryza sativa Japonica Group]BAD34399.1 hypothetical protein [Oryza sativa Japonica Group]
MDGYRVGEISATGFTSWLASMHAYTCGAVIGLDGWCPGRWQGLIHAEASRVGSGSKQQQRGRRSPTSVRLQFWRKKKLRD